jgi:hypothetical protein
MSSRDKAAEITTVPTSNRASYAAERFGCKNSTLSSTESFCTWCWSVSSCGRVLNGTFYNLFRNWKWRLPYTLTSDLALITSSILTRQLFRKFWTIRISRREKVTAVCIYSGRRQTPPLHLHNAFRSVRNDMIKTILVQKSVREECQNAYQQCGLF